MFLKLREDLGDRLEVAVALSRAGAEVSRIYGVLSKLSEIASRTRYGGLYLDSGPASWLPLVGRVSTGTYDLVIVAPATSNTVAKVVYGIADTLVTNIVSQALKSRTPVLILPSDYGEEVTTQLPCRVDVSNCVKCYECLSEGFCPYTAIALSGEYPIIDYRRCRGCGECARKCPAGAIKCWEEAKVKPNEVDLRNLSKLRSIKGIRIAYSTLEVEEAVKKLVLGGDDT